MQHVTGTRKLLRAPAKSIPQILRARCALRPAAREFQISPVFEQEVRLDLSIEAAVPMVGDHQHDRAVRLRIVQQISDRTVHSLEATVDDLAPMRVAV